MRESYSMEWWMWRVYKQAADFLHDPNDASEARLKATITAYRSHHECRGDKAAGDEHQWAMNFR